MTRTNALETADAIPHPRGLLRRGMIWVGVSCCTILVFVIALAVTMPASALRTFVNLPPQISTLNGTIWRGGATLQGGYSVQWQTRLGALLLARISADVTLVGADSQINASLQASPWTIELRDLTGRAGPGLLALAPGLPVTGCMSRAVLDVAQLRFGRGAASADGTIGIDAGNCTDLAGAGIPVPAMTLTLHSIENDAVADLSSAGSPLAQLIVTGDRRLLIRVEPAGAVLVPGMPNTGPTIIEYPF